MAPVLGYWNVRGLTSSIRNLLHFTEAEFEEKLYEFSEEERKVWQADKSSLDLDFPNLPYYIDGDVKLTQSTAILRYLGRKFNLIGENEAETQRLDLAEQQATDLRMGLIRLVYFSSNFEQSREDYLKILPELVKEFSRFLDSNKWILGDKISYVDFLLYDALDFNRLFDEKSFEGADIINSYLARFESIPQIKAYMTGGEYKKLPIFSPIASWGG
ncbi:glutathione S-transferase Mu 3-like [Bradysia coprophila]|uniref:glutathione S-transferase Mu 3-like n=1 Tax=Bradysia coprophila TaxID=38358 RepID=UPI00187D75EC|nr:glutathione S-transferase Mu 3-like [Bradysia coprophila]